MINIFDYLKHNSYPGRGMIIGRHDGEMVLAYFIMGRSENSRNRVFKKEGDTVFTDAYDRSKVKDPSLIIYNCVRDFKGKTVVTNGDQTDTVIGFLKEGKTFREALGTRTYEPDGPIYTPRISAIINEDESYTLSILKRVNGECQRLYFDHTGKDGIGHFISTYDHDGDPLPSFSGEPLETEIGMDIEELAEKLWGSLDPDNRISLYVRYIGKVSYRDRLINKYGE
ncbi:MAG: inosine monophosphate cyclohydrolase [Erysipelotrichaceae bacterium]|nr:inosine monophosphate cyclohydrolase [Erysipelotrichaceae bacterium]